MPTTYKKKKGKKLFVFDPAAPSCSGMQLLMPPQDVSVGFVMEFTIHIVNERSLLSLIAEFVNFGIFFFFN